MSQVGEIRYGKNGLKLFRVKFVVTVAECHVPKGVNPHKFDFDGRYKDAVEKNLALEMIEIDVWANNRKKAAMKVQNSIKALTDKSVI